MTPAFAFGAAGRHVVRTAGRLCRLLLSGVAFIPVTIVMASPAPLVARLLVAAFAAAAIVTPAAGLLILSAFLPIADILAGLAGMPSVRGGELLVLTFAGGWLLRSTFVRHDPPPSRILLTASAVFGAIVGASLVLIVVVEQARTDYPGDYARHFLEFMATEYLGPRGMDTPLVQGAWLIEGLGLLFAVRSVTFAREALRRAVARMIVVGGASAAVLSIQRFSADLLASTEPLRLFKDVATGEMRMTGHVTDVNAAGSAFAMVIALALGHAIGKHSWRAGWISGAVIAAIGLWLSGSRTAVMALLVTCLACALLLLRKDPSRAATRRRVLAAIGGVAAAGIAIVLALPNLLVGPKAAASLRFRFYFLQTSLGILSLDPVFGVGLSRYRELSTAYMPAPLREVYYNENAHNYFLQMACELGVAGGIAFAAVVWYPVVRGLRAVRPGLDGAPFAGIAGAALVFLLTAVGGHPFLMPLVVFPFWIVLGLCEAGAAQHSAGASRPGESARARAIVVTAVVALLAATLPMRIDRELRYVDFSGVAYGVHEWEQGRDGERYRWTGRRARLFVPSSARAVEIPMRILVLGSRAGPTSVRISVDGRDANQVALSDDQWRTVRLLLPATAGRQFRQLDLDITPTWSPADDDPNTSDRRELGIILGELKLTKMP